MNLFSTLRRRILPPSSGSFHSFEQTTVQELAAIRAELKETQRQNEQLLTHISELTQQSSDAHTYEQTRDMMLFWQLFKNSSESLLEAKLRFFRGLPKATGTLRLFQDAEIKLFSGFNDFCNNNGIRYWFGSGTLLGAYLYHGMIPWDDDIDVFVTRQDLSKLTELLRHDDRYRVTTVWDWYVPCKQIRFRLMDNNNPTFIDLFPLDLVKGDYKLAWQETSTQRSEFIRDIRKTFTGTTWPHDVYLYDKTPLTEEIESLLQKHRSLLGSRIDFADSWESATGLVRGIENIDETQSTGPYLKEDWNNTEKMTYGDFEAAAPRSWKSYLTKSYGDYLQIPHDIGAHNHVDESYITKPELLQALGIYIHNDDGTQRLS